MRKPNLFPIPIIMVCMILTATPAMASHMQTTQVKTATEVLQEIMRMPETSIPPALLSNAQGIAVVPRVIKAGLVVGGEYGHGVLSVRESDGTWSAPVFITLMGASVGYQIGAEATDFVLVFKNRKGIEGITKGKLTLGADASIAAGPVGRSAKAATDMKLDAEIYSYSRSRGLFAGVSLAGTALQIDQDSVAEFYGKKDIRPADILAGKHLETPAAAVGFINTLDRYAAATKN